MPPTTQAQGKQQLLTYTRIYNVAQLLVGVRFTQGIVSQLMPIYMFPDLLQEISPESKKRIQRKARLNFTDVDETLFQELKKLTAISMQRVKNL